MYIKKGARERIKLHHFAAFRFSKILNDFPLTYLFAQ